MRRREFLRLSCGVAAAWPMVSQAQQATRLQRIFWVSTGSEPDPFVDGFREGLRELGYIEGKHFVLELRHAQGNSAALRSAVSELAHGDFALAVSSGPAIREMRTVAAVPVLFSISGDPIELGIARSLARPAGNFTGSTFLSLDVAGKRVSLVKEAVQSVKRLAVLSNSDHPGESSEWRVTEQAALMLGMEPVYVPFKGTPGLDAALGAVSQAGADAMIVFPDGETMVHRVKIAEFAIAHKLPTMFGWSAYVAAGGLLSYGANQRAAYVRLASYADRILRGEKPADLPIEQPTAFELCINLKTAKALGIRIPELMLARADEIIE